MRVWLFDIDGTVANNTGGRGWFDWDRVGEDEPIPALFEIIKLVHEITLDSIVFLSGRDEVCRHQTELWLDAAYESAGIEEPDYFLFMREEGDNRPDDIVKRELFDKYLANDEIVAVFDDRPRVIRVWLEKGLPVFAVGRGAAGIEF